MRVLTANNDAEIDSRRRNCTQSQDALRSMIARHQARMVLDVIENSGTETSIHDTKKNQRGR
jgi:hypothetical protein